MGLKLIGIRVKKHDTTIDILSKDCHYMVIEHLGEGNAQILGIAYKLDASKYPIPIIELDVFVPIVTVIQIFIEKTI